MPGDNWADEVARALEESQAMVVLLTPGPMSPEVKRNIEYALGSKNYSNRLIPVVVGDAKDFPTTVIPWIVRRMPRFELKTPSLRKLIRSRRRSSVTPDGRAAR